MSTVITHNVENPPHLARDQVLPIRGIPNIITPLNFELRPRLLSFPDWIETLTFGMG